MFDPVEFKRVVATAGLTKTELARVYGVSRQTIYGWLDGAPPRGEGYTARMAVAITHGILSAVQRKVLPMRAVNAAERKRRVDKMATMLQSLKPAAVR